MTKANLTAVVFGGLIVVGGGAALVLAKKKEPKESKPSLTAKPGNISATFPESISDTAVQQRVLSAVASNDPKVMRALALQLRKEGHTDAATSLEQYASSLETNLSVVNAAVQSVSNVLVQPTAGKTTGDPQASIPDMPPVPLPPAQPPAAPMPTSPAPAMPTAAQAMPASYDIQLPGMTGPVQIPTAPLANLLQTVSQALPLPTATPPAQPTLITGSPQWPATDPGKISVANQMNLNLASSAKGKENQKLVKQFQTQEGGAAGAVDGKYGPTVAKRLATEYGIVPPTPMYWSSKSPIPNQKADYAEFLGEMSSTDLVRSDQWATAIIALA